MIEKDQNSSKGRLFLVFDFQFHIDLSFDRSSKIYHVFQVGTKAYFIID